MEPKVHFYLDRAISDKKQESLSKEQRKEMETILRHTPRQIWIFLTFLKNQRIKVYTGERIPQIYWDSAKERVNNKYKNEPHEFNSWLSLLEDSILSEIRRRYRFKKTEQPTKEGIQALIKAIIKESRECQPSETVTISNLLQQYYDNTKKDWSVNFGKTVNSTIQHITAFETWRKKPLSAGEEFSAVWNEFKNYLIEKNLNNSTANKYLKLFRRLLKYLADSGHINFKPQELKPFKEIESFRIALKEKEIDALSKAKYKEAHLTRARDLMILQLFTAQRVGDLPQVLEQVKRGGDIHITQEKTGKRITIPKYPLLEKHLLKIAKRHPLGLQPFSEQKYNEYIKECCKLAKIDREHAYTEKRGNVEQQVVKKRFDLVSTHTCRRTFATLADSKGISHKAIMQITGHTSHKVFLEYIRIDDETVSREFNDKMK